MKRPAEAALNAHIALRPKSHKSQKEGIVTSYCKVVNYLVETYETDDVIAEADADMMRFTLPSNKSPAEYAEGLCNKALRCDRVYDE